MDAPQRKPGEIRPDAYPDDSISASYKEITRTCLREGLSSADADDISQDLWEWLIRKGVPMTVIATPWLKAAAHNYVLRFRRRAYRRNACEGRSLEDLPEVASSAQPIPFESNELLDQIAAILPRTERNLLDLVRRGHTIAEAARMLEIPRGSRDYHKGQLIAYARREMQRRNRIPIKAGRAES